MELLNLNVLKDEKCPAIALLAVVTEKYGVGCYDWQPEFLRKEIEDDFGIQLADLQSDKIHAAIVIHTSNLYEEQWEVFKTCTNLFSNIADSFEDFAPMEAEYIAAGIADYMLIKEGDDDAEKFSDEVRAYVGEAFYRYGLSEAPDIFHTAIMPPSVPCDNTEKNEALKELFLARYESIKAYMSDLKL